MQQWKRSAVACVTVLTAVITCGATEQATYDQRQNGDRNVQVHVQDIGILALLDESLFSGGYGQYDYSYDYQDPEDPTLSATTTTTESNNRTTAYTESPGVNKQSSEGGDKQQQSVPLIAMLVPHQGSARRRCSSGFFRDSRGRCRRQRKPGYLALQTQLLGLPFGMQPASQAGWI